MPKIDRATPKPVRTPDVNLSKTQQAEIKSLVTKYKDEVNTNVQGKVVDELWKNMKQEIVAKYIAPPVLRYLAPRPTDPIVAKYIAPAKAELTGAFDPSKYGSIGAELAKNTDARGKARNAASKRLGDGMVMFYLVAPPPPDAGQAARFNKLKKYDKEINKIFKDLIKSTTAFSKDKKLTGDEVQQFTRLHYAFDLASKIFYDGVDQYFKDFPRAKKDIEEAAKHKAPGEPQIYYIIAPPTPKKPKKPGGSGGPFYIISPTGRTRPGRSVLDVRTGVGGTGSGGGSGGRRVGGRGSSGGSYGGGGHIGGGGS